MDSVTFALSMDSTVQGSLRLSKGEGTLSLGGQNSTAGLQPTLLIKGTEVALGNKEGSLV